MSAILPIAETVDNGQVQSEVERQAKGEARAMI
jgi:hypothetical protein